jgi:hypothetical protein
MEIIAIVVSVFAIFISVATVLSSVNLKSKEERQAKRISKDFSYGVCFSCGTQTLLDHNGLCNKVVCAKISAKIDSI